jgi:general secretion pathway protein L
MAMAQWLLLRLTRGAQAAGWVAIDAHGQLQNSPSEDFGAALIDAANGRRVALIVPGLDTLSLSASLPSGNEAKLQQIAPFALEDQVSEDVEDLHFAVGARDAMTGSTQVSVVSKALMDDWLALANQLQLQPQAIFADSELAPELPAHVTALIEGDHFVLRREGVRPVVLPAQDPRLALDMFRGPDLDMGAVNLVVYATSVDWQRHAADIEALRPDLGSLKVQLSSGGILALLASGMAHASPINLMQGTYRSKTGQANSWRRWRLAAVLAGALLVLHIGAQWWQLSRLRKTETQWDEQIATVFRSAMPGETSPINARKQMEKRLAGMAGGQSQGQLMSMLAAMAAAHENVPMTKVESLTFKAGSLELRVTSPDAAALEQLSQALRAGGYSAEVTAGTVRGSSYEGRVTVRAAGK